MDSNFLLLELEVIPVVRWEAMHLSSGIERSYVRYAAGKKTKSARQNLKSGHEMNRLSLCLRRCRPRGDIYSKQQSSGFVYRVSEQNQTIKSLLQGTIPLPTHTLSNATRCPCKHTDT